MQLKSFRNDTKHFTQHAVLLNLTLFILQHIRNKLKLKKEEDEL
jgi:hypothetical protein